MFSSLFRSSKRPLSSLSEQEVLALAISNEEDDGRIYLTQVHARVEGDTWFPEFPPDDFAEIAREDFPADEKHPYPYSFLTLERRR